MTPFAEPTSSIELGKRNLTEFGYTIHPEFLSATQLSTLRERLEEQAELEREAGVATIHAATQFVTFLPNKGRQFIELAMHPASRAYAEHVFRGQPFHLFSQDGRFLSRGAPQQVVHFDQQTWPFPTPIPVMMVVMVCISDFDADMGATRVLPRSHIRPAPAVTGNLRDAPIEDASSLGMIPMTAKAGAALVWESRTWHCAGAHTSEKLRCSIGHVYGLACAKPHDLYPAVLHDDVYVRLSDDEKRLLGFEVAFEYAGHIGPRSPTDARSNIAAKVPYIPELRRGGANPRSP